MHCSQINFYTDLYRLVFYLSQREIITHACHKFCHGEKSSGSCNVTRAQNEQASGILYVHRETMFFVERHVLLLGIIIIIYSKLTLSLSEPACLNTRTSVQNLIIALCIPIFRLPSVVFCLEYIKAEKNTIISDERINEIQLFHL